MNILGKKLVISLMTFYERIKSSEFFYKNSEDVLLPSFTKFLSTQIIDKQMCAGLTNLVCAICQDPINDFYEICRLQCNCQLWYHNQCLFQAYKDSKQRGTCLQCRQNISVILAWESILRKYGMSITEWKITYQQLYAEFLHRTDYRNQLRLTKLFFGEIKTFRDKLPNYILLSVFNFYEYMIYDQTEHEKKIYQAFDNNLIIGKDNYVLATSPIYRTGDRTIVTSDEFDRRLREYCYDLFDDSFDWSNIFLTGDVLYRLLSPIYSKISSTDHTFLKLFIYGTTQEDRMKALSRTLKYFTQKYGEHIFYIISAEHGVLAIYIRGIERHLRISCYNVMTIVDLLEMFDYDHQQLCYFNKKLYATPYAIEAIRTQMDTYKNKFQFDPNSIKSAFHLNLIVKIDSKNELIPSKNSNSELLTINNIKQYLNKIPLDPETVLEDIIKSESKMIKWYHPKFEESDDEIFINLRNNINSSHDEDLYFTKDINLVRARIRFIDRVIEKSTDE